MDEVKLSEFYVYSRIHKVLNSCGTMNQYSTATKYLDRLLNKFESQKEIDDFNRLSVHHHYINEKEKTLTGLEEAELPISRR